jgi:hypothetical protein
MKIVTSRQPGTSPVKEPGRQQPPRPGDPVPPPDQPDIAPPSETYSAAAAIYGRQTETRLGLPPFLSSSMP